MSTIHMGPLSKSLLVNSIVKETSTEETPVMLLLMNAVEEARNKNLKKSVVEFNQSFNETESNETLFLSKLLELNFEDLEMLYLSLCDKNRRSLKQHEKKGSFKKKTSVVEDCSFSNQAYEGDLRTSTSSTSIGRKRSQVSLSDENFQAKNCLRKAYGLFRDIAKVETQNEAFTNIVNIHLRAANYYPCTMHCVEFSERTIVDKFLCTLDDSESTKISQICMSIASQESKAHANIQKNFDVKSRLEYAKLAYKLQPNTLKSVEYLCKLYRLNNEIENAASTANIYIEHVDSTEESIIFIQILCLVDTEKYDEAMKRLESVMDGSSNHLQLQMFSGILQVITQQSEKGIEVIANLGFEDHKLEILKILDCLKINHLKLFVTELFNHLSHCKHSTENEEKLKELKGKKQVLSASSQLLSSKSTDKLEVAKIYVDCLYLCGEINLVQEHLIKLVKDHPNETLPMVYLANIRLKVGAYIASTEDFKALLSMYGEENLERDLSKLTNDEREEIARVHRLHGFRSLSHPSSYEDAADCFTVGICAMKGPLAIGLVLSRGYCYMHLHNFKLAAADFHECLSRNEKLASALCARAVLYANTTHVEEALDDFRNAFTINADSCRESLPKLPLEQVLIFSQMLIQYVKQGIENTGACKKRLYDINEISTNCDALESNKHNEIHMEFVSYCKFLCDIFPDNIDYLSTYMECLYLRNDVNMLANVIEKTVRRFPREPIFRFWSCLLLIEQRKFEDAIKQIQDVHNIDDNAGRLFLYLSPKKRELAFERVLKKAQWAVEKSKYGTALNYFDIACLLNASDIETLRGRMNCYITIGEVTKWLKDITRILQLEPNYQDYCTRAQYHQNQGEVFKACEDFIKALEINEIETRSLVHMNYNGESVVQLFHNTASMMVDLNKPKSVTRFCEAGLKIDPNHKGLRHLKERSNVNKCTIQ